MDFAPHGDLYGGEWIGDGVRDDAFISTSDMVGLANRKAAPIAVELDPIGDRKTRPGIPQRGRRRAQARHCRGAKSLLRVHRPVVVAISTNDGLAASAQHIAALMARKDYYFVPYAQDDCLKKPLSLKADLSLLPETLEQAMRGRQFEPVLLT